MRSLMVPFQARRLPGARVAWRNDDWLKSKGVDVRNATVANEFDAWLLSNFAYIVPPPQDGYWGPLGASQIFGADRYGTTGLAPHGGSGRAGSRLGLQVKGIGATPLVGYGADWQHSHGCAWLSECIHEAACSEIVRRNFPAGAVPTIAVIDTGVKPAPGEGHMPRGLLVRPFTLRPAHLQRAILFRAEDNLERSHQIGDARRTQEMVEFVLSTAGGGVMHRCFSNLGKQIAYAHAHKIYNGGMYSSNIALDGSLIDFGSMDFLSSWHPVLSAPEALPFGSELHGVEGMAQSLAFYASKYGGVADATAWYGSLINLLRDAYDSQLTVEAASLVGAVGQLAPEDRRLGEVLSRFLLRCLEPRKAACGPMDGHAQAEELATALQSSLGANATRPNAGILAEILSRLSPNHGLSREALMAEAEAVIRCSRTQIDRCHALGNLTDVAVATFNS